MAFVVRVLVQFQRHDAEPGAPRPSFDIGVLSPIADAPLGAGVEFGPCALLLSAHDPLETIVGVWDGARWRVERRLGPGETIEPEQYMLLPTKLEMIELIKQAGFSDSVGTWILRCVLETLN